MFAWWNDFKSMKTKEWERDNSSLARQNNYANYSRCRKYACYDIASKTHIDINTSVPIFEIPKGKEWHLIGRVDTTTSGANPKDYFNDFKKRKYISFSTINNKNISRYKGGVFFIYNILPQDIAHIFPMDSDTDRSADSEENLTGLPSLWLTLQDLEKLTNHLKGYNQVTCKTHRDGEIIKPVAIAAFDKISEEVNQIAEDFGLPICLCYPEINAIKYYGDMLYDFGQLRSNSEKLKKIYKIDVNCMAYLD